MTAPIPTLDCGSAQQIGEELAKWLPKLRDIYNFENKLSSGFGGTPVQNNLAFRKSMNEEWKSASRRGDHALKTSIVKKYVHDWGGVHSHGKDTLERYAKTSTNDLIALGMTGISSWSKAISIRSPRAYPIYDARVAISLNALQAIILGDIRTWFEVPRTQIEEIAIQARRLKKLSEPKSRIPHKEIYREYLRFFDRMGLARKRQRTEMLLFSVSREITAFLADLPDASVDGPTLQAFLPVLRQQLKV